MQFVSYYVEFGHVDSNSKVDSKVDSKVFAKFISLLLSLFYFKCVFIICIVYVVQRILK